VNWKSSMNELVCRVSGVLKVSLRSFCKGFGQKAVAVRHALLSWFSFGCCVVKLLVSLWGFSFPKALLCAVGDWSRSPCFGNVGRHLISHNLSSLCTSAGKGRSP